jgi:hypothetical protein
MIKTTQIKKEVWAAILASLLVLVIAVLVLFMKFSAPAFDLNNADSFKMPAGKNESGTGMSFLLPKSFNEVIGDSAYLKMFVQKDSSGKTYRSIIAFRRLFNGSAPTIAESQNLKGLESLITRTTSVSYYNKSAPGIQKFNSNGKLTNIKPAIKLSEIGIKSASEIDEEYRLKAISATPAEVDASVKYILGKNASYYLIISSQQKGWQKDKPNWQKVLASLKTDL